MALAGLETFWIVSPDPHAPVGFGVTAFSLKEALLLLRVLGHGGHLPDDDSALRVVVGCGAEVLGAVSSWGPLVVRGVWYPFFVLGVPTWVDERLVGMTSAEP